MALPLLVLDTSAALALLFVEEEGSEVAAVLRDVVESNGQVFVPALFWYELENGILVAQRRKRITVSDGDEASVLLGRLPIATNTDIDAEARGRIMTLARIHELSFYDAAYLELSLRLRCRLKSCDKHLLVLRAQYSLIL